MKGNYGPSGTQATLTPPIKVGLYMSHRFGEMGGCHVVK